MPAREGTTVGTIGSGWRGVVTPWGALDPCDGSARCDWWIGADDRWHEPAAEPSRRQERRHGTPVVETAIRVPSGDAVQRVYAVADHGGLTVIEVENRSPVPFAVALSRNDLVASRPPSSGAAVPAGAPLPAGAALYPVAHRTTLRLALAHAAPAAGALPTPVPDAEQVARGWLAYAARTGRVVVPDASLGEAIVAARCDLALEPLPDASADPAGFLLAVAEEPARADAAVVAAVAERLARRHRRAIVLPWDVRPALFAASVVLRAAGEPGAAAAVAAAVARLASAEDEGGAADAADPARRLARVLRRLVRPIDGGADLLPGVRPDWFGQGVEAHGLRVPAGTVGFAVRWHGARPAVLWECSAPMRLTASALDPSWSVDASRAGEALLGPPPT